MQFMFTESSTLSISLFVSLLIGYAIFAILLRILPKKLKYENNAQQSAIMNRAVEKKQKILEESSERSSDQMTLYREELESDLADIEADLKIAENELDLQEVSLTQTESRIVRDEGDTAITQNKVQLLVSKFEAENEEMQKIWGDLQRKLEIIAECNASELRTSLTNDLIQERQLESQRLLMDLTDQIQTQAKKISTRILSRTLSRYSPRAMFPRNSNNIELLKPKLVEVFSSGKHELFEELAELSEGVEISFFHELESSVPILRLGGGYGIYREAVRLTLEELISKGTTNWPKAAKTYERHKLVLEKIAFKLGRQAVSQLRLTGVHDEIMKMIGALNWRTSYRQNQYYHSLEVAMLSGILADEIGENRDIAKRCGLLHDIGKGLDYKIEGSHAVISADFADRYGESRLICNTVMSHHNDLIQDTTLSYILKTADTLSGARPGARVHLEEGYQIRLTAIDQSIRSFPGILKVAIMSGGREVHVEVNHKKIRENELEKLTKDIVKKIENDVAFPGQIKIVVTRRFEAVAVA